jgi:peptide/nickel transport system substrate-binding protein
MFLSHEVATRENKWQGRNVNRWISKEFDDTHAAAEAELDPVKRVALLIKCNDLVVNNQVVIPIVYRPGVSGVSSRLKVNISGWDSNFYDLADWFIA